MTDTQWCRRGGVRGGRSPPNSVSFWEKKHRRIIICQEISSSKDIRYKNTLSIGRCFWWDNFKVSYKDRYKKRAPIAIDLLLHH